METHSASPRPAAAGHPVSVYRSSGLGCFLCEPQCKAQTASASGFLSTGCKGDEVGVCVSCYAMSGGTTVVCSGMGRTLGWSCPERGPWYHERP